MQRMWMAVLVGLVGVTPAQAAESAARPRLAVAEFDLALSGRTLPPGDMGSSAAQTMVDRLVSSGAFQVYDARWLAHQKRGHMDLDEMRAAAERAGIDYLALGTITQFSEEQSHRRFGGGPVRWPVLGGASRRSVNLVISVLVKLVDVRSGEILTTATGFGSASRSSISAGGLGLLKFGGIGGYSAGSERYADAQLGEAMERSIDAASRGLAAWR